MKSAGVGAVEALAGGRAAAKTFRGKRVLWQSGGQRRELAAGAAVGRRRRRGITESGARAVAAEARRVDELTGVIASEGLGSHAPPVSRRKSLEIAAATCGK